MILFLFVVEELLTLEEEVAVILEEVFSVEEDVQIVGAEIFSFSPGSQIICQVCPKPGHSALTCYHRFDQAYQASPPSTLSANYSALGSSDNGLWYPDSGASHHMTSNFSNMNLSAEPYSGNDKVYIGDGSPLPISHQGAGILPTPHSNFLLTNLLRVPFINKNLLSVSQFCKDNHVFFEFHDSFFLVKDKRTKFTLFQGQSKDHLYTLQTSSGPHAFISVCAPLYQWHQRLGHPALKVMRQVLQSNSLPVSSSSQNFVCQDCRIAKSHFYNYPTVSKKSTTLT